MSIKIKLYLDFNGQFQYMFLRMIASKKVYFAQLLSQKTFYEFVKGKFSIIFIGAGVKLPALKGGVEGSNPVNFLMKILKRGYGIFPF